jgi:oxygen-dependent protoporphyrinogen oxidase
MNPLQFLASRLFSIKAKLRLLAEPFISAAPEELEETIAEFVTRRLGKEFLDYAVNPFVAGVYAGDPARLSVRSAVAKIYALEKNYGSLIKGAIKGARKRKQLAETDKTKARLFSFQNGMSELANTLAKILANSIQKNSILDRIELPAAAGDFYTLSISQKTKRTKIAAKSLIFATPAHVTAGYLESIDKSLSSKLQEITYPPVAVVFSGFKKHVPCRPLDGFGFLVPRVESRSILGTIWNSAIFPNRAPEGGFCLTTFMGGMRQPDLLQRDDRELGELVFDELKDIMQLQEKPDVLRIKRWQKAIPQYELGHQNRINEIEKLETEHPGLFISGNFRNGISVGDCIIQSKSLASKIVDYTCAKCDPESQIA